MCICDDFFTILDHTIKANNLEGLGYINASIFMRLLAKSPNLKIYQQYKDNINKYLKNQ